MENSKEVRVKELQPYIVFIRDYNGLILKPEEEYQSELIEIKKGAELQWKSDREKGFEKNEVSFIDPKEFGVEEEKAKSIELAFAPSISEREELSKMYKIVIGKEITHELIDEAVDLGKKLVKNRTGISRIHKTQKSFALAYGKLCDAWKNKETEPILQMEEGIKKIKDHFDNIEKEKIQKIEKERISLLEKYEVESIPEELGHMPEDLFDMFLSGAKTNFENKKAEEEKQKKIQEENERLKVQYDQRKLKLLPYSDFIDVSLLTLQTSEEEFNNSIALVVKAKKDSEEKAKKQEEENAVLRKEKEEAQEKLDAIEKEKLDDLEREKSKGDKEHVQDMINALNDIKDKYEGKFKSKQNLVMFANVQGLIDKTIVFIKK
jgi:hypothetical protein